MRSVSTDRLTAGWTRQSVAGKGVSVGEPGWRPATVTAAAAAAAKERGGEDCWIAGDQAEELCRAQSSAAVGVGVGLDGAGHSVRSRTETLGSRSGWILSRKKDDGGRKLVGDGAVLRRVVVCCTARRVRIGRTVGG